MSVTMGLYLKVYFNTIEMWSSTIFIPLNVCLKSKIFFLFILIWSLIFFKGYGHFMNCLKYWYWISSVYISFSFLFYCRKKANFMMQYCIIYLLLENTCILWLMQQCYDVILHHPMDCLSKKFDCSSLTTKLMKK